MSRLPRLKINLLAAWGDYVVGLAICVVLMPFVLHTLGDSTYGLWLFINSIAGYSGLLNLGFGETISRYVATHYARKETDRLNQVVNVIGAVYVCTGTLALLIAGVLAGLAPYFHDWSGASVVEIRWVILILGLNTAIGIVGSVFGGVLVGIQRFDIERGMVLISGIVRLALTLLLLKSEWGLLTLALIFLAVTAVENIGYVVFAFSKMKLLSFGRRYLSWSVLKECVSFSGFAFLHNIAQKLIVATDNVVIGIFFGPEAIVPYFIAARLCDAISQPVKCIGTVMMPRAGELHANEQTGLLNQLMNRGIGFAFLLMMGFFIGAGFFGKMLITVWVGSGYDQSHLLLLVLLGARIVATPMEVVRSVLFGMGRVRIPAFLYAAEAVANLVLTLILIRPFGLMGVAWGTAIPLVAVELGLLLPYALRQLRCKTERLFRDVLTPQLLPLIALLVYSMIVSSRIAAAGGWLTLILVSAGGGVVLFGVWIGFERLLRKFNDRESYISHHPARGLQ